MDKKPQSPNPPIPQLPDRVTDFFNKVAPQSERSPLHELQERFSDKRAEERRITRGSLPMPNHHGPEYIVELRIREWMMRMEREARDAKEAAKHRKPPAP